MLVAARAVFDQEGLAQPLETTALQARHDVVAAAGA